MVLDLSADPMPVPTLTVKALSIHIVY